jgi:uncharacterized protein YbjT (DUF2867 family)
VRILVTGITGYVGGALAPRLAEAGHDVVGLSRDPRRTGPDIPVLAGDVNTGAGLDAALDGVDVAYYLAHSLESANPEGFATRDRRMAQNFVAAARTAGVRRVIHLGIFDVPRRSSHQESRIEVDEIVRATTPESLTLRSGPILAPDNWYMQAMANLVKRVPVVTLPERGRLLVQPIDGRDVTECLAAAATSDAVAGHAVDIAGPDVITQRELVEAIARRMGRRRLVTGLPRFARRRGMPEVFARVGGGDPAILKPLFFTGLTDNVAHDDGAARLDVVTRGVEESLDHTLTEMGLRH